MKLSGALIPGTLSLDCFACPLPINVTGSADAPPTDRAMLFITGIQAASNSKKVLGLQVDHFILRLAKCLVFSFIIFVGDWVCAELL